MLAVVPPKGHKPPKRKLTEFDLVYQLLKSKGYSIHEKRMDSLAILNKYEQNGDDNITRQ